MTLTLHVTLTLHILLWSYILLHVWYTTYMHTIKKNKSNSFSEEKTHTFSSHEIYIDKDDVSVTASKNPFNNVKNGRSCLLASPLQMYNTKCHLKTKMKYWTLQNHFCNINMGGSCINYQWKTLSTLHKMTSTGDLYEDKTTPNHSKNIFTVAHHVDPIKIIYFFFCLESTKG